MSVKLFLKTTGGDYARVGELRDLAAAMAVGAKRCSTGAYVGFAVRDMADRLINETSYETRTKILPTGVQPMTRAQFGEAFGNSPLSR